MLTRSFALLVPAMIAVSLNDQPQDDALSRIRDEGLRGSQVGATFDHLTTVIGPRLTGTPAHRAAAEWSKAKLAEWGLTNARLEPWEFGRGWALDRLTIEMVEPRYMPLIGYAEAWSAPTHGEIVSAPVFVGDRTASDQAAIATETIAGHSVRQ